MIPTIIMVIVAMMFAVLLLLFVMIFTELTEIGKVLEKLEAKPLTSAWPEEGDDRS